MESLVYNFASRKEEGIRSLWNAAAMDRFCSCGSILHQQPQLYFSIPIGAETALMASEDGKEGNARSLGAKDRVSRCPPIRILLQSGDAIS